MSGTVKRVAVRLAIEGADQARAQIAAVGNAGQTAMTTTATAARTASTATQRLTDVFQQGRSQIGQFVMQVQNGTGSLASFAQQATGFLVPFGPAGAVVGATATVGALAAAFLSSGETAEQAQQRATSAAQSMGEAYNQVNDIIQRTANLFLTVEQRAAGAAASTQRSLSAMTEAAIGNFTVLREQDFLATQRIERDLATQQRLLTAMEANAERIRRAGGQVDTQALQAQRQLVANRNFELGAARTAAASSDQELQRLMRARDQQGLIPPPEPPPPPESSGTGTAAVRRAQRDAERELNDALRERTTVLRSLETPFDTYLRRVQELTDLQARLPAQQRLSDEQMGRATERMREEMERAQRGADRVDDTARQLGMTFSSAFEDAVIKGGRLSDVLKGIEADLARIALRKAITEPLANAVGGLKIGDLFSDIVGRIAGGLTGTGGFTYGMGGYTGYGPFTASANGNVFGGGQVVPFERGGVVSTPTVFPMAKGGVGLMGEAGPEAIMPLRRDSQGRLGVAAPGGGGGVQYAPIFNIDARGADAGMEARFRAIAHAAVEQGHQRLMTLVNRGGSTAKTFGRRR